MNDSLADWEEGGLPSPDELTPLSQSLISPALACAFSITPPPSPDSYPAADVQSASQSNSDSLPHLHRVTRPTVSMTDAEHVGIEAAVSYGDDHILPGRGSAENPETSRPEAIADQNAQSGPQGLQVQGISAGAFAAAPLQHGSSPMCSPDGKVGSVSAIADGFSPFMSPYDRRPGSNCGAGVTFTGPSDSSRDGGAAAARKLVRVGENEEADSGSATENTLDEQTARTLKRPRLVWTQQLHKRFVDAVAHLGIKHAVPKTIMHLMNVDGLTRENVASHLQKYRLYLKRMQGLSNDGPSASDQLFASSPVPPSLAPPSAHFLSSQRRYDVFPLPFPGPLVPVPLPGLVGHAHLPSPSSHTSRFTGFDPYAFNTLSRTAPQRSIYGDNRERVGDIPNQQPSSPPPQILTLFPTGGL